MLMSAETLIHCGKYEAAYYLKNELMARFYLKECIKGAVCDHISEKQAINIEIQNILDFAKSHYDVMTLRRIDALLNRAVQG
jgi:hypothetical protein